MEPVRPPRLLAAGAGGELTFLLIGYINMVVSDVEVERGFFESTFMHELAHLALHTLLGHLSQGPARKMHQSMSVTDCATALDEGWAEHFEAVVVEHTENPWLLGHKPLPEAALAPSPDPFQVWLEGETLGAFLPDRLKSGQAMISSDGVAATLCYRIVTSEELRNRWEEPAFYAQFLPPGIAVGDPRSHFSPYENVNLKLFAVRVPRGGGAGRRQVPDL